MMTTRLTIDPFNRLEGDLRVELSLAEGRIAEARAAGVMFRGFERILPGRDPMDAVVITPRICGICSASHGVAAAKALSAALGTGMPANAFFMRNLILACEVVMSHLSHFYMLFAPDLANPAYEGRGFYPETAERFAPLAGTSVVRAVKARQSMLEIMGLVAGKWPNTLAMHPAGSTATLNLSTLTRAVGILQEFRDFLERHFLGCPLDLWLDLDSYGKLEQWLREPRHRAGDLGLLLRAGLEAGFDRIGEGPGRFLSAGAYDLPDGRHWLPGGVHDGQLRPFDQEKIREHIAASFYRDAVEARHPLQGVTNPCLDKQGAYSWAKAPRYDGKTMEVGPLARLIVASDPLVTDLRREVGVNVLTRMLARQQEMLRLVRQMGGWLECVRPDEPFYAAATTRWRDEGIGFTEAARGTLGHWIRIAAGAIDSYQVITPSAWNLSPRDGHGMPGPVEEALAGLKVADPANPVEVNHVIRSFDPCMSCTVH